MRDSHCCDRLASDLNPRPFYDETTPGQQARAWAGKVAVVDLGPTTISASAEGGTSLQRASGRVQGWTLRPKELPQATYQRADRTESGGGRERPEPRPEVTRVLERKCEVRERRVAANLGFL